MNMSARKLSVDIDFESLKDPFPPGDIEWRVGQSGLDKNGKPWARVLAYVTARAVMNRLDDVCGPENWKADYTFTQAGTLCHLAIRFGDEWITKTDGAEQTDIEAFKGGISGALKRAASAWGIGRYLYRLEDGWAEFVDQRREGTMSAKIEGKYFNWLPPQLPDWALPGKTLVHTEMPVKTPTPAVQTNVTKLNQRVGIKAPPATPAPAEDLNDPKPQGDQEMFARQTLSKRIMAVYNPYITRFPNELGPYMIANFETQDAGKLSLNQLLALADHMEKRLNVSAEPAIVPEPTPPAAPGNSFENFVMPMGIHKGKTFKQMLAELGRQKFEGYFAGTQKKFMADKGIPRTWIEIFPAAETFLYGELKSSAEPAPTDPDDIGL